MIFLYAFSHNKNVQLLSASSGINLSGNVISTASYQNQAVFQTILGDSACPLDLVYWEVNVSKAQEYKIGISHRFMKPGKGKWLKYYKKTLSLNLCIQLIKVV